MKYIKYVLTLLAFVFASSSQAAIIDLNGMVTTATGAFASLVPPGTMIGGPLDISNAAVSLGVAGPGDINTIDFNVGGFCFSTQSPSACPVVGSDLMITSIDAAALTFPVPPNPGLNFVGGTLDFTAFSPTFGVFFTTMFDLNAETFFTDGGALGTVGGNIDMTFQAIPIPGAIWLFGSGLIGLVGIARRRKATI